MQNIKQICFTIILYVYFWILWILNSIDSYIEEAQCFMWHDFDIYFLLFFSSWFKDIELLLEGLLDVMIRLLIVQYFFYYFYFMFDFVFMWANYNLIMMQLLGKMNTLNNMYRQVKLFQLLNGNWQTTSRSLDESNLKLISVSLGYCWKWFKFNYSCFVIHSLMTLFCGA